MMGQSFAMGGPPPFMDDDGPDRIVQQVVQAPPMMIDRPIMNTVMQGPQGPAFEMEPEFLERIVEIPRVQYEHVERLVEVPQPQVVDRIVEVPMIQEIIKEEAAPMSEKYVVPVERQAPVV